jgi:hypothetical protein
MYVHDTQDTYVPKKEIRKSFYGGSATLGASPLAGHSIFLIIPFLVHRTVNQDDRHLLAHE